MIIRFKDDERGQFSVLFSLLALPLLAAVSLAMDVAMLSAQKANLQSANDATALYAAKYYQENARLPSAKDAQAYMNDLFELDVARPILSQKNYVLTLETAADAEAIIIPSINPDATRMHAISTATIVMPTLAAAPTKATPMQAQAQKRALQSILRDIQRGKRISRDRWLSLQDR